MVSSAAASALTALTHFPARHHHRKHGTAPAGLPTTGADLLLLGVAALGTLGVGAGARAERKRVAPRACVPAAYPPCLLGCYSAGSECADWAYDSPSEGSLPAAVGV